MDTSAVLISTMLHRANLITAALERVGWSVVTYNRIDEALDHLRNRPFAAVFCDEVLRGGSVAGFLTWSRRIAPDVPFYVVGNYQPTHASAEQLHPDGIVDFPPDDALLPRPVRASMWDVPAPESRELPLEGEAAPARLVEIIQMLALSGASSLINLAGGTRGSLYLHEGLLVHALYRADALEATGVRALARVLALDTVAFQVLPFRTPPRRTIHVPTPKAISEAVALVDELQRHAALLAAAQEQCPDASGLAVGYLLADQPSDASGSGESAFALAATLLEAAKRAAGPTSHLAIETDQQALAAVRFANDHVLAGTAPRGRSMVLLTALAKAVKQQLR